MTKDNEGQKRRCGDCDDVRAKVNTHAGMFKILLGLVGTILLVSGYGVGLNGKLTPRITAAEAELRHIPKLIQKNDETSTAVIILGEEVKHMTASNKQIAEMIKIMISKMP